MQRILRALVALPLVLAAMHLCSHFEPAGASPRAGDGSHGCHDCAPAPDDSADDHENEAGRHADGVPGGGCDEASCACSCHSSVLVPAPAAPAPAAAGGALCIAETERKPELICSCFERPPRG